MRSAVPLLCSVLLLSGGATAAEPVATTVVLVDATERLAAARDELEQAADLLQRRAGAPVLVLGPGSEPDGQSTAEARRGEALGHLQEAQAHYEDFDLERARAALGESALALDALTEPEIGELKLQLHWLQAQIAIVVGDTARAATHVRVIARLAPWWEPPVGFLTPEVKKALLDERSAIAADEVRVHGGALPPGAVVRVDGLAVDDPREVVIPAGRHVLRVERPGYRDIAEVLDLRPGQHVDLVAPFEPAWSDAQRRDLRRAVQDAGAGERARLLDDLAAGARAALVVVAFEVDDGKLRARVYGTDPAGWRQAAVTADPERVAELAAAELPRIGGAPPRGPVQPLLALDLGGGARLVGSAGSATAAGGGLAVSFGGGVALREVLGIRALVGVAVHGPAVLPEETGDAGRGGTQQGFLIRAGVEVGPRIPLGRGTSLLICGGGGFAFGGVSTELAGAEAEVAQATGGYVAGAVGLEHAPRPGLAVGPVIGLTHAGVPVEANLTGDHGTLRVAAQAYSVLEFQLRISVLPPG